MGTCKGAPHHDPEVGGRLPPSSGLCGQGGDAPGPRVEATCNPPPPPFRPLEVLEHVFLQIWENGAACAKEFFLGTWYGLKLFNPPTCGNSKCLAHIGDFKRSTKYA